MSGVPFGTKVTFVTFVPPTVTTRVSFVPLQANVVTFCVLHHFLKHVYVLLYQKNMPRVRVRETDRGLIQPDVHERAFLDIGLSVRNISLRAVATSHLP